MQPMASLGTFSELLPVCLVSHDLGLLHQIRCYLEVSTRSYFSSRLFVELLLLSSTLGVCKSKCLIIISLPITWSLNSEPGMRGPREQQDHSHVSHESPGPPGAFWVGRLMTLAQEWNYSRLHSQGRISGSGVRPFCKPGKWGLLWLWGCCCCCCVSTELVSLLA